MLNVLLPVVDSKVLPTFLSITMLLTDVAKAANLEKAVILTRRVSCRTISSDCDAVLLRQFLICHKHYESMNCSL